MIACGSRVEWASRAADAPTLRIALHRPSPISTCFFAPTSLRGRGLVRPRLTAAIFRSTFRCWLSPILFPTLRLLGSGGRNRRAIRWSQSPTETSPVRLLSFFILHENYGGTSLTQRPATPAQSNKKTWTSPAIRTVEMKSAQGSSAGPKCDKLGSLSHGTGCP